MPATSRPHVRGYLRSPAIHDDAVVFVCEDDLWSVSASGGRAVRLTTSLGGAARPRLSPDGDWLAFTGWEDGPTEVYVMPASGGEAERITYQGVLASVAGWTPQGDRVLYASSAQRPFRRDEWIWAVSPQGGEPELQPYGPATAISFGPGKRVVLGRNSADPARWKRYRGGTAGEIWVDASGKGVFTRLVQLDGNLANPCWVGDRIYFLADHEGVGNVYSVTVAGKDLRRHTDHEQFYARSLASDGRRLVYHAGAELYLLDPSADQPSRLDITLGSSRTQRVRRFVSPSRFLDSASLSGDGMSMAVTARGKAFTLGNFDGPVLQHGELDGTRYRLAHYLNDGKRLVAVVSDEAAEEALVVLTVDGSAPERRISLDAGRATSLEVAPWGDQLALANHRNELLVIDLAEESPAIRVLDRSDFGRMLGVAWSPDARHIAYGYQVSSQTSAIRVVEAESGTVHQVTEPVLVDMQPAWDPEGKYLYFISRRDFDPVYDGIQFELSFPKGTRPFVITLREDVPSPFLPTAGDKSKSENKDSDNDNDKDEKALAGSDSSEESSDAAVDADNEAADEGKSEPKRPPAIEIEFEGIARRILAFPVPEGRYRRVAGLKGKALFTNWPVMGSRGTSWSDTEEAPKSTLDAYDFHELKIDRIADGVSDFAVSRDGKQLLYKAGRRLRVIKADKPPQSKPGEEANKPGRSSGWIDLERIRVSVQPGAEWRQMFREAWRLQRDHFWSSDMQGINWDDIYRRYSPLVDLVTTRAEFSDLMWEMQGELGTSHAYEMFGDYRPGPSYRQGYLGADFGRDSSGRWVVGPLLRGDPWDQAATSPFNRPGVNVRPGDVIIAINGQPIGERGPGERLVNLAGQEVAVTVQRGDEAARSVAVRTIGDERAARYRDWVEAQRRTVHERTGGRVGYVHIPDMGPEGFAEFHRGYLAEFDHDGLIVDVRYNGGGHVSGLLLEKLARPRLGYDFPRWGAPEPYPAESPRGALVAITNEHAGSDGDIFSHSFKMRRLGPLIGKRTWGGVIGISPSHALADGTLTTQPEYSFFFDDVGWQVENYGTDPDIDVDNAPQDYAAGRDPQLDTAIEVVLRELETRPPHVPQDLPKPNRAQPSLPPRPGAARRGRTPKARA